MQVPKRKSSKSRVRIKKNSHYVRPTIQVVKCESCGSPKLPHRVCPKCKR
ncbi:TPA: 50S ribosomal protein L32 [candidate division WWE3 bacterium]|uniref:Large ribosomal subunit protein bL32 n=1 Tax=candidate division WWE3 bacterium TaxID=2053526 RepID=A0A351JTV4_UNCKA|nr:50S ribosomal protein L32 [candidate division WWE3 bacterium]